MEWNLKIKSEFVLLFFNFKFAKRSCLLVLAIASCFASAAADEYGKLENLLNSVDKPRDWTSGRAGSYKAAPPVTPTPQAFNPTTNSYMRPGMPYSAESIPALTHSVLWRYMKQPQTVLNPASAGTYSGANPFNLSPFGMLHYMWDDTTYVSAANPVTLYQTQSRLQTAQRYSQLAEAASRRARYAKNSQEREEAARQAGYYAGLAQQAAREAKEVSESGSLNPADVAEAAAREARQAQGYARQAGNYAQRGF